MDIKNIKKNSWYRQQTEGTPYFIYPPCCGCLHWFKDEKNVAWMSKLDEAKGYLDKDHMRELAEKYLKKEKENLGSLMELFQDWLNDIRDVNKIYFDKIEQIGLEKFTDEELLETNKKLADQSFVMWTKFFMDIYDVDSEGLVERELVEEGVTLLADEKAIMMSQSNLLSLQREELDMLRIVEMIKKVPEAKNTFLYITAPSNLHRLKLYPEIEEALEKHKEKYFWIRNNWAHTENLAIFDFVEILKQMLFSSRDVDQEIKKLNNFEHDISKEKKVIADKHDMSDWLRGLFDFFGLLYYWRDERKVEMQMLNHYLELLGTEIAKRSGITWNEIKNSDAREINSIPVNKYRITKFTELIRDRFVLVWDGEKVKHLSKEKSKEAESLIESNIQSEMTEIRGMIACPGKIKGEVVVINKKEEFSKMEEGKILVTNMTRPEFVPLMKKAIAIVTDEGGITSHAAVVSRELRVPCIIGTQVATKMLKDGDNVFVNADHGVVLVEE